MEEKTVPRLDLGASSNGRAALRRRFSLLDLNLRQTAQVLLTSEEFAAWTTASPERAATSYARVGDTDLPFASPRNRERRYAHLQAGYRAANTVDRLSVPCRLPHFLGQEQVARGLAGMGSASSRSRSSKLLSRLSMLSPRSKDKLQLDGGSDATGVVVMNCLWDLLQYRQTLDKSCELRALLQKGQLDTQITLLKAGIQSVDSVLQRFAAPTPEARDLHDKLLQLAAWDLELYSQILPWLEWQKPAEIRVHAVDLADLLRSPLDDASVLQAVQLGLDANEAVAYRDAQWKPEAARLPGAFNDRCLQAPPACAWASGGMGSVYRLTYQAVPAPVVMVWKPEDPAAGSLATDIIGITSNEARGGTPSHCAGRSVATYRVAQRLGLCLVPRTEWAVHQARLGTAMAMAQGLAPSSKAPLTLALDAGTAKALRAREDALEALARRFRFRSVTWSAQAPDALVFDQYLSEYAFDDAGEYVKDGQGHRIEVKRPEQVWVCQDFASPSFRRELTRLQWLDHLTGQVDRNPMNYLVAWGDDGRASVSAIDNDLSFPAIRELPPPSGANCIWLPAMPTVIDSELAEAIVGLGDDDWQQCLHGLMMPSEFQFACARLAEVKAQIGRLKEGPGVVDPADETWASAGLASRLGLDGIEQAVSALTDNAQLDSLWVEAAQHSYLRRDAVKQAMVRSGCDRMAYFDALAIRAYVKDGLLKG